MASRRVQVFPPSLHSARALCCDLLTAAEVGPSYLDHLMEQRLAASGLSTADRALVTAITNGTMRWRARLDAELAPLFRKDYASARPYLKNILRTALFQMRFLDRVPAYAALHEAVALARAHYGEGMARLCNAVLRQAQRAPYEWPDNAALLACDDLTVWSQTLSLPAWMLAQWIAAWGREETLALATACNQIPDLMLRVVRPGENRQILLQELAALGVEPEMITGVPEVYRVPHLDQVTALRSFVSGACTVQDASASLVALLAAPQSGETAIDLCAAPGGKALHVAELLAPGTLWAVDASPRRLRLVQQAAARLHLHLYLIAADARQFSAPQVDLVLVDAPCSGLGVLGRRSDLRWRRRPEEVVQLAVLQQEILAAAAGLVRRGGRLIYSTCTITPEENDGLVAWFLQHHPEFELQSANEFLDARFCDAYGFVRTFPHRHGMDGSFAARLLKVR